LDVVSDRVTVHLPASVARGVVAAEGQGVAFVPESKSDLMHYLGP
jgi:hypothetical protein